MVAQTGTQLLTPMQTVHQLTPVVLAPLTKSSTFDPRSLGSLQLWLDATRISGLNDGDPVATWSDLSGSGSGNDATQATSSKRPLYKVGIVNGKPVVRFDGVDDDLLEPVSIAGAKTLACVVRLVAIPSSGNAANVSRLACPGSAFIQWAVINAVGGTTGWTCAGDFSGTITPVACAAPVDTSPHIVIISYSGGTNTSTGSYTAMVDGVARTVVVSGTSFTYASTDLGALGGRVNSSGVVSTPANIDMATVGLYSRQLSTAEMTYLSRGWGSVYGVSVP